MPLTSIQEQIDKVPLEFKYAVETTGSPQLATCEEFDDVEDDVYTVTTVTCYFKTIQQADKFRNMAAARTDASQCFIRMKER